LRTTRKASEEGGAHATADVQCTHGGGDEVDGRAPAVLAWLAGMAPRPQREAGKLRERVQVADARGGTRPSTATGRQWDGEEEVGVVVL
jgi:hypothetical protein